jgi:hypothetical protein
MKKKNTPPDPSQEAFDAIRKALPQLSARHISQLQQLLEAFYTPKPVLDSETDWLLSGIEDEMERRGIGCPPLTPKIVNNKMFAEARKVRELLERSAQRGRTTLTTTQWYALGRTSAKCLARLIEQQLGLRPTVGLMLNKIARVTEALDNGFPGYLEAGLICMLVRVREPVAKDDDEPITPEEARGRAGNPSTQVHIDEHAAVYDDDGAALDDDGEPRPGSFAAWNERHQAEREAEREQFRNLNKKLLGGKDPPAPPAPQGNQYDEYGDHEYGDGEQGDEQ